MSAGIREFYNACDPLKPPPCSAEVDCYVPCSEARGNSDAIDILARRFRRAETPLYQLFAGHFGGGKSTELRRLRDELQTANGGRRFRVVYVDAEDYVDRYDVVFADVALAILSETGQVLRDLGLQHTTWLRRTMEHLMDLATSDVIPEKAEFSIPGLAKFIMQLKQASEVRDKVRANFRKVEGTFVDEINICLRQASRRLQESERTSLALIVDNLEKIEQVVDPKTGLDAHRRLFVSEGKKLRGFDCPVLYSISISMVYSGEKAQLETTFGSTIVTLPMVKVSQAGSRAAFGPGVELLAEMVRRRARYARVPEDRVFSEPGLCEELCRFSGGHVRNLLIMVRNACDYVDELPVTRAAVSRAMQEMVNSFSRSVREDDFPRLARVARDFEIQNDAEHQRLLYELTVLDYLNGEEPWQDVNPAVRSLKRFKRQVSSSTVVRP